MNNLVMFVEKDSVIMNDDQFNPFVILDKDKYKNKKE